MVEISQIFDLSHTLAAVLLAKLRYPWQALPKIRELIQETGPQLGAEFREIAPGVWAHRRAELSPGAQITSPCIIGAGTQIRHGAFIRGSALVGRDCVVGNSTELKNAILFDGVQAPHFNYVGDSILGYRTHLGAGAILSNVKSDRSPVTIRDGEHLIQTGLSKCGAMVGDFGEVGCNAVLNPGTVLLRRCTIYPGCPVRGVLPENAIVKPGGNLVIREDR